MEAREYHIETLEQLLNVVNKENVGRITVDFSLWLHYYVEVIDKVREANSEFKDKTNTELMTSTFSWVDDGKNDLLGTSLVNKDTGETTYYDFTQTTK